MTRTPGDPLLRSAADLVASANSVAPPLPLDAAAVLHRDGSALFVDIREPAEWKRDGVIPGAYRAPRGMLEFWVDPASPYHRPELDDGRRVTLKAGQSYQVGTDMEAHRSSTTTGARLFVVD